jgi:hypothetical protein
MQHIKQQKGGDHHSQYEMQQPEPSRNLSPMNGAQSQMVMSHMQSMQAQKHHMHPQQVIGLEDPDNGAIDYEQLHEEKMMI